MFSDIRRIHHSTISHYLQNSNSVPDCLTRIKPSVLKIPCHLERSEKCETLIKHYVFDGIHLFINPPWGISYRWETQMLIEIPRSISIFLYHFWTLYFEFSKHILAALQLTNTLKHSALAMAAAQRAAKGRRMWALVFYYYSQQQFLLFEHICWSASAVFTHFH